MRSEQKLFPLRAKPALLAGLILCLAAAGRLAADQADSAYSCTPKAFSSTVTWYDNAPLGLAACHYSDPTLPGGTTEANQFYAAAATHLYDDGICGACALITDSANGKSVTVMVTDECPASTNAQWCSTGSNHLDLSEHAFTQMEASSVGVFNVTWHVVPCPLNFLNVKGQNGANLSYQFKSGASAGWAALIIRDYIMPIKSVEYCTGSGSGCVSATWQRSYNGWVPNSGSWNTFYLRITDKGGNQKNFGPLSCCAPVGTDSKTETSTVYTNLAGGQMPGCGGSTNTYTSTATPSGTVTRTPTPSATRTITPLPAPFTSTATATPSASPSASSTRSSTASSSATPASSATSSATPSSSATATFTRTVTPSPSSTGSSTFTLTMAPTGTATSSITQGPSSTSSSTRTTTPTRSSTSSVTQGPSSTHSSTATATPTPSGTGSATFTRTVTPTGTATSSTTPGPSSTRSSTRTTTPTSSSSATQGPSSTSSSTATPTATPSRTDTPNPLPSGSPTATCSGTPTPILDLTAIPISNGTTTAGREEPLAILKVIAGPNPLRGNTLGQLYVHLRGVADSFNLKFYTPALVEAYGTVHYPGRAAGWSALTLPIAFTSQTSSGTYFLVLTGQSNGRTIKAPAIVKLVILH